MTTATRRRKRQPDVAPTKGESWAIIDAEGKLVRDLGYGVNVSIAYAQHVAQRAPVGSDFYVEHRFVIGPPTRLYRVANVEGVILTTPLANTD